MNRNMTQAHTYCTKLKELQASSKPEMIKLYTGESKPPRLYLRPFKTRLQEVKVLALMEDYSGAFACLNHMLKALAEDNLNETLSLSTVELVQFLIVALHVLYKDKHPQMAIDLVESLLY